LYYNPGNVVSITANTPGNSTATCQARDTAIGGNFDVISYARGSLSTAEYVVILYDGNESFDKYSIDVFLFDANPNDASLTFTTNVLCFNNP
jgi:hypothetical protein